MERLGIPRPPGVALGDRVVHGWNPDGYAALLGVDYRAAARFTPAELASRLDRVLESAQRLVARFDARQMDHVPPERKRTLRDLAFHVFRLSLGFADAVDRAALPESVDAARAEVSAPAHQDPPLLPHAAESLGIDASDPEADSSSVSDDGVPRKVARSRRGGRRRSRHRAKWRQRMGSTRADPFGGDAAQ